MLSGTKAPGSGLSSEQARLRLAQYGPNRIAQAAGHPLLDLLKKFWAPIPWMLELAMVLELALARTVEAAVIGALLVFNVLLSHFQERRANQALALLKSRLVVQARVFRDHAWKLVQADELVPGDRVHLRMGDIAPADVALDAGELRADQSTLTGESRPVEKRTGDTTYAGSVIQHGEATGTVSATGARTYFGRTAELVRTARAGSHLGQLIFRIVRYLLLLDGALIAGLVVFAAVTHFPLQEIAPFALILLVAAVPAALPATFTLATALGARELSARGVLVTHLGAIEEAAAMDVLACDKTGTLTENRLTLMAAEPVAPFDRAELLRLAALASDASTQDPIDLAVLAAAGAAASQGSARKQFIPFDPASKRSAAVFEQDGVSHTAMKGAVQVIAPLTGNPAVQADVARLAGLGYRVLAVAKQTGDLAQFAGLLGLEDPPRADSADTLRALKNLGVRLVMITGDSAATAQTVARQLGLGTRTAGGEALRDSAAGDPLDYDIFAGVVPEDKFRLVRWLQQHGHVAGMTGDGVNDAPALKQAEVGIAVASATDVAKAAASIVLTVPGLSNAVAAVETSRRIYQRMLTYTLNKIIKAIEIGVFLTLGVMLTRELIVTPVLIVLLLFTNDFVTMSIATDHVTYSPVPDRWDVARMMAVGAILAALVLVFSFSALFIARDRLHLPLAQVQTLVFVILVLTGQGMVYLLRCHGPFWSSRPSRWLLLASGVDIAVVLTLARAGILMAPLTLNVLAATLVSVVVYLLLLDFIKQRLLNGIMSAG
ncbi:MAG: plasma-membrane proton-efflux P-type ATPase [Gammaproteobacteria bacterium]|nr:plasma-membrane proton-efflux P-type ATPase [Gammaproteobacteria bacterium]